MKRSRLVEKRALTLGHLTKLMMVVVVVSHVQRTIYVHETEETYTATQLNFAKLTKEPSATYQIRLWSQRDRKVNRPHHGDILLRSPPWFGIETTIQLVSYTNPATSRSLCI